MDIYGRFTERAQKALMLAQEEARALGHNYVGTEHLLLGLLREGEGAAARILQNMGITIDNVRGDVERLVGKGDYNFNEHFGFTPRTKKVMELSLFEAKNLGHSYIGTEHLLLALVRKRARWRQPNGFKREPPAGTRRAEPPAEEPPGGAAS